MVPPSVLGELPLLLTGRIRRWLIGSGGGFLDGPVCSAEGGSAGSDAAAVPNGNPPGSWGFIFSEIHSADVYLDGETNACVEGFSEGDLVIFEVFTDNDGLPAAQNARKASPAEVDQQQALLAPALRQHASHVPLVAQLPSGTATIAPSGPSAGATGGNIGSGMYGAPMADGMMTGGSLCERQAGSACIDQLVPRHVPPPTRQEIAAAAPAVASGQSPHNYDRSRGRQAPPPPAPPSMHGVGTGQDAYGGQQGMHMGMAQQSQSSYPSHSQGYGGGYGAPTGGYDDVDRGYGYQQGGVGVQNSLGSNAGSGHSGQAWPSNPLGMDSHPHVAQVRLLLEPPPLLEWTNPRLLCSMLLGKQPVETKAATFTSSRNGSIAAIGRNFGEVLRQVCEQVDSVEHQDLPMQQMQDQHTAAAWGDQTWWQHGQGWDGCGYTGGGLADQGLYANSSMN